MALPTDFEDTANQRYEEAKRFWRNWQGSARDAYAFVAGDQWLPDDESLLKEQKRPTVTFNYSEKMIDAVCGAEVSSRQEVTFNPRELSDAPLAEMWTNANRWARDESNAEDEDTDAFRDCLICGMGWTHTKVAYETDADGMIELNRVDPLEMLPDPSAIKPGVRDRRYNFRLMWVDESIVKTQWPDAIIFSEDDHLSAGVDEIRRGHRYEGDPQDNDEDRHRGQVQIRHYECIEREPFYRVAADKSITEMSATDFGKIKKKLDAENIKYVKQYRNVYYYAYFAGNTLLEGDVSPTQVGFTYNCITGKRDRNRNTWYGLTRVMMDPQRWANKWLSQILHIVNSNAKGGLIAEVGAFVDPTRAQESWASPEGIVLLKEGGISKIKEKAMTTYPSGLDRLMEFALSSLPQVTGINLEALGLAGREQANVLEQSRKQAAYGLLAPIFDSLRRYRKDQGRISLDFIHNYISDGRMIRIGGPDSQQFLPLTKAPNAPRYDIIVDQSPTAPDVKTKTWEVLQTVVPAMMKAGVPIPPDVLDYSPIPAGLATKWKQFIQSTGSDPSKLKDQMQQLQQQMQQMQQENQDLQLKLKDKQAEIAMKQQEAQANIELDQAKAQAEFTLKQQKLKNDMEMHRQETNSKADAAMYDIIQSGHIQHNSTIMTAMNDFMQTVADIKAQEAAEKEAAKSSPKSK